MQPQKMTEDEIENAVYVAVREAVDFVEAEVAEDRILAQRYFNGEVRLAHEEGRSKVVATKCRDTIRAVKPSLMRVFLQSGVPVEFTPRTPDAVQGAEQATKYAKYIFERNNGFDVLASVFHDALIKKVGVAKVYYDETEEVDFEEYTGLIEEQVAAIMEDGNAEIVEQTVMQEAVVDPMGMTVKPALYDLKVSVTKASGGIKIEAIAPEDFFVDRSARSIRDCYVCGHTTEGRVSDLVEMGFDFDVVYNLAGTGEGSVNDEEEFARVGWNDTDQDENINDPSMRKVLITEAYMKMDIEGVGVAKLYKFLCAGDKYKVLDYEPCDYLPFAVFEVDPEPHTFFGRSLVDIIIDDQDAATSLMRGLLDNMAMVNNPRLVINENGVDAEDAMNNEIGAIIRAQDVSQVRELVVGGMAQSLLPAMQFYDESIRAKTGVSGAGMGLDADALQSQTAAGVNAAVQAANQVSELIARTLAEGGMKQMFDCIAKLARANPNPKEMIRVDGQFVPVDPSQWGAELDLVVNVGLGTNQHAEKVMTLQQTLQYQIQAYSTYGPTNGMVTLTNIRNTLADIMVLGGVHNADRYLQPMNPQIEQQLLMQAQAAAQQQGQQSDPNAAFMQSEQMKAQTRAQVDMQKATMEHQRKLMEMATSDDLKRDEMAQDLLVEAAKILGQYGTTVDVARVKAEQDAPRSMPMQVMNG